jgi:enamine deaminase RidA (YjgF/YER057c/UK114 family)
MSGGIAGLDCRTGIVPDDAEAQVREMFANVAAIMQRAGSDVSRIVKMTFYAASKETRAAINDEWTKAFPDPQSRPARHTVIYRDMPPGVVVQCDLTAWLGE